MKNLHSKLRHGGWKEEGIFQTKTLNWEKRMNHSFLGLNLLPTLREHLTWIKVFYIYGVYITYIYIHFLSLFYVLVRPLQMTSSGLFFQTLLSCYRYMDSDHYYAGVFIKVSRTPYDCLTENRMRMLVQSWPASLKKIHFTGAETELYWLLVLHLPLMPFNPIF